MLSTKIFKKSQKNKSFFMQKVLAKNRFLDYTLGMDIKNALEEVKELDNFMRELNELRRRYPNVLIDSESGFEAVEASINQQIEYIPKEIKK